jgi:2-amino-4-hydroxy-6-hydroxymethyldihydropteridine diphosphokinase
MSKAYLSIGSNLGDRFEYLQNAVLEICNNSQISKVKVSSIYETTPVGGPQQDDFLNAVIEIETQLSPNELLAFAQQLEQQANRVRTEHWGPRTLDVDILDYENVVSNDSELTLPHPRISERAFVVVPWFEISPNFVISGLGKLEKLHNQIDRSGVQLNRDMKLQVTK